MGIRGLWETVKPAQRGDSLLSLTTKEGYLRNPAKPYLVLGVDMNLWIDHCQVVFQRATLHTHAGENPEMRIFFFKLCRYLKLPAVLVFVSDGPGRPSVKRGRAVRPQPLWMTAYVQELVAAFGFYFHQAPGEAEAELAKLNSLDKIDAILTDDSDALVFGAECIIRSPPAGSDSDHVLLYTSDSIEHSDTVKLTRGGLVLFALLAGGDYNSGIDGCGRVTAHALAKCGFGDALLDAATPTSIKSLDKDFLDDWRQGLQDELRSNSQGYLRDRNPCIAERITTDFPDLAVLDSYLNPLTSWSPQSVFPVPNANNWKIQEPLIPRITSFCVQHLGWGRDNEILRRFHANLWEGVAFRLISSPVVGYDSTAKSFASPTTNATLSSHTASKRSVSQSIPCRRLLLSTQNFRSLMGVRWANISLNHDVVAVHVPEPILEVGAPSVLLAQRRFKLKRCPKQLTPGPVASGSNSEPIPVNVMELTDSDEPAVGRNKTEVVELSSDSDENIPRGIPSMIGFIDLT